MSSQQGRGQFLNAADAGLGARVQWLIDREKIRDVLMSYCRGVDRRDYDLITSAYHPDAWDDHGNFEGGPEAVVAKVAKDPPGAVTTSSTHLIGNIRIELEGDVARVESYFVAYKALVLDGRTYTTARAGRYLDRFERRECGWRIARRKVADDWSRMDEVVAAPEAGQHQGARSKEDPSYTFLSA